MNPIESGAPQTVEAPAAPVANREVFIVALLLLVYVVIRVAALPPDPLLASGMSHDAAYLNIVAKNLLAGKGFILDALWLVFLQPDQLPMPYHNANPLFPVCIALTSKLTGWDVLRASFLLSALASAGVIVALTAIVIRFVKKPLLAFAIAFGAALFPVVWDLSWLSLTDEFSLMLLLGAIAALWWGEGLVPAAVAGVLFGLSWLTRSMAVLAIPAIFVWLVLRFGWRKAAVRAILFGVAAFVVSLPWLIHNLQTWGDPFRSDNGYTSSIAFYYRQVYGGYAQASHAPEKPLPMGVLLGQHGVEIVKNWIHSLRYFFLDLVTGITGPSYLKLGLIALLTAGLAVLNRSSLLSREGAASGVYLVTFFLLVSGMGPMEPRYFLPGYALFAAWLFVSVAGLRWNGGSLPARGCMVLAGIVVAYVMLPAAVRSAVNSRQPDPDLSAMMRVDTAVNQTISHGEPVVVGFYPYFYSLFTGAQSLAIPMSDDTYLLSYMQKYHACCIVLNEKERAFWRPQWDKELPPHIVLLRSLEGFNVYGVQP